MGPLNTTAGTLAVQPASDDLDVDASNARVLVGTVRKRSATVLSGTIPG